jgi:hypothetical protein
MHHSRILSTCAVAAAACLTSGGLASATTRGGAEPVTLAHATDHGTKVTLTAERTAHGTAPYRTVGFVALVDGPEVDDGAGGTSEEDGGDMMFLRVAERATRPLAVQADNVGCNGLTVVAGTALPSVAKVLLVHGDGTRTPLRRRTAPKGWHYAGAMLGAVIPTTSPLTSAIGLDRDGRMLQTVKLEKPAC